MESGGDAIDARGAADVPAVPAVRFSTEPHRRDPELVRSFMRRRVVVFTAAPGALLLSIAWEVTRTAPDVDLSTGPGLWFLMGLAWIGAFAASLWFVPPAWSGLCLAAVAGGARHPVRRGGRIRRFD